MKLSDNISKERLMSAEFVEELFLEEDLTVRQENIGKCQLIAKGYGCKLQFDELVKAQKQAIKEERKRQEAIARDRHSPDNITWQQYCLLRGIDKPSPLPQEEGR